MKRLLIVVLLLLSAPLHCAVNYGPFIQISPTGGNGVPPLLAVAANGNAFAAWINFPNTIQAAFFNATTGVWTSFNVAIGSAPQIGIDQLGNAFLVWVSTANGPATQILATRFNAATMTFSAITQLSTVGTYNSTPQIAVSGNGVALAIWFQNAPQAIVSRNFNPATGLWSPSLSNVPVLPASFALDNFNHGFLIIDSFSGPIQGAIQVSRITITPP